MATTDVSQPVAALGITEELPHVVEATTSRVVVNNPLLRVVQFVMDAGQELTDHATPRAVVVQCLEGSMSFTIAGAVHEMGAGDVLYMGPGERHAVVATSPLRFTLVMIDTEAASG